MPLVPGTRLGPYEIVAAIGAGGMGEVYRATDPRLRREVAVKVLKAGITSDPQRLKRFEQEAMATASLNHAGILAVYDVGVHEGCPYIVSELLQGQPLRDRIESAPRLSVRKSLEYGAQIAAGLAAAHDKAIVHRDLKPENLFITRDDRVKILDFGLAKLAPDPAGASGSMMTGAEGTEPGLILGTVGYMSPEQVRGATADHRSDIFAFGAVLYEMLSGRRAFAGASAIETLHAILEREPAEIGTPDRLVPPALERTVRRCLEKSPDQRFQSARDLAFSLDAMLQDSGTSAPAAIARPPRVSVTRWIAAGLLVAAGAAAGWLASLTVDPPQRVTFKRLTFRNGTVQSATFAPDGQTIVYSAAWQGGPTELFSSRLDSPESRALGQTGASIFGISPSGEMALRMPTGALGRAPLAGGDPHEAIDQVVAADWARDGRLAVVRSAGGRRRVEFPAGTLVHETASVISGIAISPDGQSIACIESPPGLSPLAGIGLIDRSGAHRVVTDGWREMAGLAWSPDGRELWFPGRKAPFESGTLVGVTPDGRLRQVLHVPARLQLYDVRPDGRVLLGRTDSRFEARGMLAGDTGERDLSWFDSTGLSDISPDGRTLVITESGAHFGVYLRKAGATSATRVTDGGAFALSPDGKSIIVQTLDPPRFSIVPIGPGEPRIIPHPGFEGFSWANWFPDGTRILLAASETGHRLRLYVEDLDGGGRRPIGPEGIIIRTGSTAIRPDGTVVAAIDRGRVVLLPVAGGTPRPVPGLEVGDLPIRWTDDGRFLYAFRQIELRAHVFRVNVESGAREPWKTVGPADAAGVTRLGHVILTPDGTSYAYNYLRTLSELYLVEGLK